MNVARSVAKLLFTALASGAGAVGIHHAAHAGNVSFLEFLHRAARFHHPADDLVPWDAGIHRGHDALPFIAHLVQIGMAHPAIEDFNLHVLRTDGAAANAERRQPRTGALRRVCFRRGSLLPSLLDGQLRSCRSPSGLLLNRNRHSYFRPAFPRSLARLASPSRADFLPIPSGALARAVYLAVC